MEPDAGTVLPIAVQRAVAADFLAFAYPHAALEHLRLVAFLNAAPAVRVAALVPGHPAALDFIRPLDLVGNIQPRPFHVRPQQPLIGTAVRARHMEMPLVAARLKGPPDRTVARGRRAGDVMPLAM